MRSLAKVLVLVNAGLSIVFLFWAIAIYTERINWFTGPAAGGAQSVGMVDRAKGRLDALNEANQRAASRWATNYKQVADNENLRPYRRDFYRYMLYKVQTGTGYANNQVQKNMPVTSLEPQPPLGLVVEGKPIMLRETTPLDSIDGYNRRIGDAVAQIKETQDSIVKLIKQQTELTNDIYGTPMKKGLRTLLAEQEQIARGGRQERDFVRPFRTNREAEYDILLKRVKSIEERLGELQKFADTRGE
jgi:hypothetical protein